MINFFTSRAKAFLGALALGVAAAALKAAETASGFDIPAEAELAIMAAVTGWVVNYTDNVSVTPVVAESFIPVPEAAPAVAKFSNFEAA